MASGPRVKLASCKSALNPTVVYSTDCCKAVVPVLVLLFVALWFILQGDLFYVLPCVILFLCFSVLLALRLPRLGKTELTLVLFVRLFDLRVYVSSSSWCLGRAAVCDCGTPWTFLLPFFFDKVCSWGIMKMQYRSCPTSSFERRSISIYKDLKKHKLVKHRWVRFSYLYVMSQVKRKENSRHRQTVRAQIREYIYV